MIPPDFPANEPARLRALGKYDLLGAPLGPHLDDLTQLAAHILGTSGAAITVLDTDSQWFRSRYGVEAERTDRSVSFCGHIVADPGRLVVPDAWEDPRFHDNPLVTGDPWIRFYAGAPLTTPEGFTLGALCVIDSEPRQPTEQQLHMLDLLASQVVAHLEARRERAQQHQYRKLFGSPALLPAILERDGTVRAHNNSWTQYTPDGSPLHGRPLRDVLVPDDRPAFDAFLAEVLDESCAADLYTRALTVDGLRWLTWTAHHDPVEDLIYALARDVTSEQQLQDHRREVVAMVTHDLRTPLSSIQGTLELLASGRFGEVDTRALGLVTMADNACDRLIRMVDQLLDVEQLDAGGIRLRADRVQTSALLEAVVESGGGHARQLGVTLQVEGPDLTLKADGDRLVQALTNLVTHAVGFTPSGGVVRLDVAPAEPPHAVRFTVTHHGPVLTEAQRTEAFARYSSVTPPRGRPTGLALSVSRGLVELHGGRIGVDSAPGEGTCYWFTLPAAPPRESRVPSMPPTGWPTPVPGLRWDLQWPTTEGAEISDLIQILFPLSLHFTDGADGALVGTTDSPEAAWAALRDDWREMAVLAELADAHTAGELVLPISVRLGRMGLTLDRLPGAPGRWLVICR